MAIQKKHAKARLDKYYYLAKEKGYRARAAFKLIQLNKKYSFLQNAKCLIDLCAAPGSWLQVAAETMPQKSLIVGVDLSPIKPIPKTITFQGDITTDKCRAAIRGHLKTWKADCVIHDGAPNVGTAWVQDAFSQNDLVLSSLRLATEFLAPNGTFVTKVFRSKDSAKLEWIFKQLFSKVEQTKPPSSRNVSAETFYVCRGYKAPKHLDPKFLDPAYAFMEAAEGKANMEARVFNPEKKKRKREGYEEGDWTQFNECPAYEFIQTHDPIDMLGRYNRFHFDTQAGDEIAQAALAKIPDTTEEVRQNCEDLKVLGRKEFKVLLRWRLKARDVFGLRQKKEGTHKKAEAKPEPAEGEAGEEVAMVESMDDEMRYAEEVQALQEQQNKEKRKERRKENERKQKDIVRMQMGMTTPSEIGIEAGENDPVFRLKDVDKASDVRRQIVKGRMHTQVAPEKPKEVSEDEEEEDEELDELEAQLDCMYEDYQSRREDHKAKARAKRARKDDEEPFEDFDKRETGADSDASDEDLLEDDDDDDDSDTGDECFTTDLQGKDPKEGGLSRRAASFFQQDIFSGIDGLDGDEDEELEPDNDKARDSGIDVDSPELKAAPTAGEGDDFETEAEDDDEDGESDSGPEDVAGAEQEEDWEERTVKPGQERETEGRPNIDIITAEAMTLAHQLATGKVTKQQLLDDNFNKYSLRDVDGLPEWFLDDENKHAKLQRPVSKEAAAAIKEKLRALNARPIKKVREAKARKTMRTARRLEKLKKKSEGLAEDGDMGEREKAGAISKLMAKAAKGGKKRQPVKVVKAGGQNKGSGRPRGVKGKYKMVDARLKKDTRGLKRAAKRQGKK
ncbi:AdoMet-dependent rRNA methyltransferase spb1 [Fulvia fulva]|nr:AdoMet-dependent rRNA methyltransferase spb1 [Fulvia fulva]KAK4633361.1 AdoMet-dependent rRNA methyltransferase spb1 [Fulvia fulva]WPV10941.1 AdoMet-dependent rRNA methyltransferase spb1 [Fulvia fulva]WPV25874.1 AdoMet-dependent rRNA methyltransferase spb1 [Fulvia fulva]